MAIWVIPSGTANVRNGSKADIRPTPQISTFLQPHLYVPIWFMDTEHNEPQPPATLALTPATRRDGWSGEKMAKFCETLAETAVVAEACDAVGMHVSGAYA